MSLACRFTSSSANLQKLIPELLPPRIHSYQHPQATEKMRYLPFPLRNLIFNHPLLKAQNNQSNSPATINLKQGPSKGRFLGLNPSIPALSLNSNPIVSISRSAGKPQRDNSSYFASFDSILPQFHQNHPVSLCKFLHPLKFTVQYCIYPQFKYNSA